MTEDDQQKPAELTDTEAKALVKLHTQLLYAWADKSGPGPITRETQKALMASVCRLFDCIENMQLEPEKERKH